MTMDKMAADEDLMIRIARGEEEAFEMLVCRHQKSVLNLIYRFLGDRMQAQDLAQDVFLKVWQAAERYEPKAKFTTWLYRITANLCFNELKRAQRKKFLQFRWFDRKNLSPIAETTSNALPSAEDLMLSQERRRQVSQALESLPANQRLAVIMKKYDDLSYHEIAQIMGCSVSAVESLMVRAKRKLYERLKNL